MYDYFDKMDYDLELRGLAGGLFKAKWLTGNKPKSKISNEYLKKYRHLFMGDARQALFDLEEKFTNISRDDYPDNLHEIFFDDWLSFAVRFSNRIAPRTWFQINRFKSFNPFYDRRFLDTYLRFSAKDRENGMIHLKMIEYLYPELLKVPYLSNNKYYFFSKSDRISISDDNLIKLGFKKYNKSKSNLEYLIERILSKCGLQFFLPQKPVPADWEYIKEMFLKYFEPVFADVKCLYPSELGQLSVKNFRLNPNLDSRSYRLYSLFKFISHCKSLGVSFK